jgi:hypothetical protein
MCEKLNYIFVNTKTQRREDTKFLLKNYVVSLCLCVFAFTNTMLYGKQADGGGLESIRKQTIEAHLSFLACDALEGREAGKRGGRIAAEYIQAELKELGIKPFFDTHLQAFEAYSPAREKHIDFQVNPDSIARYKQLPAYRRLSLQNVVGYIKGERKDEYVVVGAHYDHVGIDDLLVGDQIYNGADDNAASVAALLQVVRAFAASGEKPLRNVIFAFWDGEEVNYLGSEYFVENFENTAAIKAYINLDMISREGLMPILYPEFVIPEATEENTATGNQFHLLYTEELTQARRTSAAGYPQSRAEHHAQTGGYRPAVARK